MSAGAQGYAVVLLRPVDYEAPIGASVGTQNELAERGVVESDGMLQILRNVENGVKAVESLLNGVRGIY
jgi:hypothetical protein